MMDSEDRHREIMNKLHEMHQHNLDSHGSIAAILLSMRDNAWHKFEILQRHLMRLVEWNKKDEQ
jgi:hypothetical protein